MEPDGPRLRPCRSVDFEVIVGRSVLFEEADLIEDWCIERSHLDLETATRECVDWLRDPTKSPTRQQSLREPQQRAKVRADMRAEIRRLRGTATKK